MPYVPAAIRYNNPGAQYPGRSASAFGSTGYGIIGGGHKIAQFPDPVSGAAAQFDLLTNGPYSKMPLGQAIRKWSGNNSSDAYIRSIADETGLDPSKPVTARELSDPNVAIPLAKAMAKFESGRDFPLADEDWQAAHSLAFGGGAPSAEPYASGSPAGNPVQQPYSGLLDPNEEPPATGSPTFGNPVQADTLPLGIPEAGEDNTMPARAALTAGRAPPPGPPPGPPTGNLPFGIPGTVGSNPIQQALGDNFSTLLAFAGGARSGGIGQGLSQAARASLVSDQQRELALHRQQDMAWRRLEATRAQSNADRTAALQARQFEEGKVPIGYRRTAGGGLEFIPKGPADPEVVQAQTAAKEKPRQFSLSDIGKLTEEGQKFGSLTKFGDTFQDKYAGYKSQTVGGLANTAGRYLGEGVVGKDIAEGSEWWQGYDRFKNVVRNDLFGSALTVNEQAAFEKADINPGMTPKAIRDNIKIQQDIAKNGLVRKANALIESGYKPEAIAKSYGLDLKDLGVTEKGQSAPTAIPPPATPTIAPPAVAAPVTKTIGGKTYIQHNGQWFQQ